MIPINASQIALHGGQMVLQFVATGTNIPTWPELSDQFSWMMTDHLISFISEFYFKGVSFLKYEFSNWLECDNYVQNFPAANPHGAGISNGAKYYEVLTADNNAVDWKPAGAFTDEEIEDRMVIVGNSEQFDRKFYGLCR